MDVFSPGASLFYRWTTEIFFPPPVLASMLWTIESYVPFSVTLLLAGKALPYFTLARSASRMVVGGPSFGVRIYLPFGMSPNPVTFFSWFLAVISFAHLVGNWPGGPGPPCRPPPCGPPPSPIPLFGPTRQAVLSLSFYTVCCFFRSLCDVGH